MVQRGAAKVMACLCNMFAAVQTCYIALIAGVVLPDVQVGKTKIQTRLVQCEHSISLRY